MAGARVGERLWLPFRRHCRRVSGVWRAGLPNQYRRARYREALMMEASVAGPRPVLVLSAIEQTWPADRPIIFLGDWCLRHSRRHVWENLDYTVAPYHWDDRSRLPEDLVYISDVYESLLPQLARVLNDLHGVDYSTRYWRIVVGWWLFYFAQIFFDRWQVIQGAAQAYPNAELFRLAPGNGSRAAPDMPAAHAAFISDRWNERLSADVAERWTDLSVRTIADREMPTANDMQRGSSTQPPRPSLRSRIYGTFKWPIGWPSRLRIFYGEGIALYQPYLPMSAKVRLYLLMGQVPSPGRTERPPPATPEMSWRSWKLPTGTTGRFVEALVEAVPQYLPSCFLEGYEAASAVVRTFQMSSRPRVIMTAQAFSSDSCWLMWAAAQCELGSKLVIGQHGGHYGAVAWSASQMHEVAISDRYLSWGWTDAAQPKVRAAPANKLIGSRELKPASQGACLLVNMADPQQSCFMSSAPVGPQVGRYLDDQFQFAAALSNEVRSHLLVRQFSHDHHWDVAARWHENDSRIKLVSNDVKMKKLLRQTRLYVATYNSTTFLESFTHGIPTVMFWNPRFWELSADAEPYFDALRRAGILFDDPVSCANHVSAIWSDVSAWWLEPGVQRAVASFTNRFAYVGPRPLRNLKAALTDWDDG